MSNADAQGMDPADVAEASAHATELMTSLAGILRDADTARDTLITEDDRRLAEAHFNLADALWAQEKDAQAAITEFCSALSKDPNHVEALCGLASVLADTDELDAAIKALRRALIIAPRHAVAHFYLGSALGRKGDFDGAIMEYGAVLEYEPNSRAAELARVNLHAAAQVAGEHPLTYEAGLPAEAIQQLSKFRWADIEGTSCSICIKDFVENDEVRALPCAHMFHAPCIDEWLRRRSDCPLCKADVVVVEPPEIVD